MICKNIMLEDMDQDVLDAMKENIEEQKKDQGMVKLNIVKSFQESQKRIILDRDNTNEY